MLDVNTYRHLEMTNPHRLREAEESYLSVHYALTNVDRYSMSRRREAIAQERRRQIESDRNTRDANNQTENLQRQVEALTKQLEEARAFQESQDEDSGATCPATSKGSTGTTRATAAETV